MSDNDTKRGNGWSAAESWVRDDIKRLEAKVDALVSEVAEARGRFKTWHLLFVTAASLVGGGAIGVSIPNLNRDHTTQIQGLQEAVKDMRKDVDRIIRAGDNR